MATCARGPLAVLSQSTGHGGHMKGGQERGDGRGAGGGLANAASFGV